MKKKKCKAKKITIAIIIIVIALISIKLLYTLVENYNQTDCVKIINKELIQKLKEQFIYNLCYVITITVLSIYLIIQAIKSKKRYLLAISLLAIIPIMVGIKDTVTNYKNMKTIEDAFKVIKKVQNKKDEKSFFFYRRFLHFSNNTLGGDSYHKILYLSL